MKSKILPLFIQILLAPGAAPAAAEPSNISANGFPNWRRSSDVLLLLAGAWAGGAPNKSTIGAACAAGGVDKKGFVSGLVPPVGDETLD